MVAYRKQVNLPQTNIQLNKDEKQTIFQINLFPPIFQSTILTRQILTCLTCRFQILHAAVMFILPPFHFLTQKRQKRHFLSHFYLFGDSEAILMFI